eukprot:CAMPEP_0117602334 /NCGR_PEP_ID=MMETSP0784-20121206/77519_1 /TAXON_ID=39447 /ORGANISM="" /LENGTH=34 /DNA_ID= /DNA_START= /DNA_END= /DNA_ORIENTATION=
MAPDLAAATAAQAREAMARAGLLPGGMQGEKWLD